VICPKCGTEYREQYTMCSDCRVMLVTKGEYARLKEVQEAEREQYRTMKMVSVYKAQGSMEADLIRAMLTARGIESFTSGWAASSVHPFTMDGMGEIRIMVREDDSEEARRLIAEDETAENARLIAEETTENEHLIDAEEPDEGPEQANG